MNLNAIQPRRASVEKQMAAELTQRNRAAGHANILFRNTAPVVQAIAQGLQAQAAPVKPVASDLGAVVKTLIAPITESVARATAAVRAPVRAPQPASMAPARPSSGNPPSVPLRTETQLRREADAREEARRAAAKASADHVLVTKGGARVMTLRSLDAKLSDPALLALNHVVSEWERADRRPVRIYAADLATSLDMPLATAQSAFTELLDKRLIISTRNSAGIVLVQPGLGVTGS